MFNYNNSAYLLALINKVSNKISKENAEKSCNIKTNKIITPTSNILDLNYINYYSYSSSNLIKK